MGNSDISRSSSSILRTKKRSTIIRPALSSQQQQQQRDAQPTIMTLPLSSLLLRTVVPLIAVCIYMAAQFSSTAQYRNELQIMRTSQRRRRRRRERRQGEGRSSSSSDHVYVPRRKQRLLFELPNDTVWNNVQYYTGTFGNDNADNKEWEQLIMNRCGHLSGYYYTNYDMPFGNHSDVCSGPIHTNTTCCYCYYSDANFSNMGRHRSWACAMERNHSLLPLNTTRVNYYDDDHHHHHYHKNRRRRRRRAGPKIAWITGRFGHADHFEKQVKQFCHDVLQKNYFDAQDAHCLWQSPDYVLQNPKFQRHLQYRNDSEDVSTKGGGFWFHKSVVIRHYLDLYRDGDLIVYTDVDRMDFFDLATYNAVMETLIQREEEEEDEDDLCMEVIGIAAEYEFSKEDMLTAFNASKETRRSGQSLANVIVFRNSPKMRQFIDAWVECMADWHMVTDDPSILPNTRGYHDHRHDQSVISLLVKTFMTPSSVVGPPARPYAFNCELFTYRFRDDANPTCPFAAYYASPEYAALMANITSINRTSTTTTTTTA